MGNHKERNVKGWPERLWNLFDSTIDRGLQNSLTVIDDVTREVRDGNTYHVSHLFSSVLNGSNARILLQTNGDALHMRNKISTEAQGIFRLYEAPTVSSNGTALSVIRRNRFLSAPATGSFFHTPTVTNTGTELSVEFISGGDKNQEVGGASGETAVWVFFPNTLYLIDFLNNSGGAQTVSMSFDAFDEPVDS